MRKRLLIISLIVLFVALVAFALNEYVRETIAPAILTYLWQVYVMSQGFPQVMTWAFFLAAIPVIAIFSLIQGQAPTDESPYPVTVQTPGQVQTLAHWIQQAPEGDFFKMRLLRHLAGLALDTMEYGERLTPKQAREMLESGRLQVEPDVRQYLEMGWRKRAYATVSSGGRLAKLKRRYINEGSGDWRDPNIEKVIQFIESELEVGRET